MDFGLVEYDTLVALLGTSFGKAAAVCIAIVGLWQMLVNQKIGMGILILSCSIALLWLPRVAGGVRDMFNPALYVITDGQTGRR